MSSTDFIIPPVNISRRRLFLGEPSGEGPAVPVGRIEKGQPAHAAEEHERHEYAPGGAVRLSGDADGEAHSADGGGPFKEAVQEGQPVPVADEEASRHKQYEIHEKDREGQPDGFRRKPAAEALHVPAEAEGGRGGRQQGVEGGGLDAPAVEPGPPPMSMRMISTIRPASVRVVRSTELKPAVRAVTDWKSDAMTRSPPERPVRSKK